MTAVRGRLQWVKSPPPCVMESINVLEEHEHPTYFCLAPIFLETQVQCSGMQEVLRLSDGASAVWAGRARQSALIESVLQLKLGPLVIRQSPKPYFDFIRTAASTPSAQQPFFSAVRFPNACKIMKEESSPTVAAAASGELLHHSQSRLQWSPRPPSHQGGPPLKRGANRALAVCLFLCRQDSSAAITR